MIYDTTIETGTHFNLVLRRYNIVTALLKNR